MKKLFCDICNAEIDAPTIAIIGKDEHAKTEVVIYHEERTLDICDACHNKLVRHAFYDMQDIVNGRF